MGHPQDRKKKIIKEWNKTSTNGTSATEVSAHAAAAAAAARSFVDFPGYDGNPIHYPYAYPDMNTLVHPAWHHHSLHQHHQHNQHQVIFWRSCHLVLPKFGLLKVHFYKRNSKNTSAFKIFQIGLYICELDAWKYVVHWSIT